MNRFIANNQPQIVYPQIMGSIYQAFEENKRYMEKFLAECIISMMVE